MEPISHGAQGGARPVTFRLTDCDVFDLKCFPFCIHFYTAHVELKYSLLFATLPLSRLFSISSETQPSLTHVALTVSLNHNIHSVLQSYNSIK